MSISFSKKIGNGGGANFTHVGVRA